MKTTPRWIVPLEPGQVTEDGPALVVIIKNDMTMGIWERRADEIGMWNANVAHLPAMVACQLGQALLDAAKWVGQERARRERR